jgi:hypothetical protein
MADHVALRPDAAGLHHRLRGHAED